MEFGFHVVVFFELTRGFVQLFLGGAVACFENVSIYYLLECHCFVHH